jgi:hypothetical protein
MGKFYIWDIRTPVGNCAYWWRPGGKGYTCDLDEAGLYDEDEARSHRETDIAVPQELAERLVVRHVRFDHLRQNLDVPYYRDELRQLVEGLVGKLPKCECGRAADRVLVDGSTCCNGCLDELDRENTEHNYDWGDQLQAVMDHLEEE